MHINFNIQKNSSDREKIKQRVLTKLEPQNFFDPGEKHHALYIQSDPQNMPYRLQMVDKRDGNGHLPCWSHVLAPVSQVEKVISELQEQYGSIVALGETYALEDYTIGFQRFDPEDIEEDNLIIETIFQRKNIKQLAVAMFSKKEIANMQAEPMPFEKWERLNNMKNMPSAFLRYSLQFTAALIPSPVLMAMQQNAVDIKKQRYADLLLATLEPVYSQKMAAFYMRDIENEKAELVQASHAAKSTLSMLRRLDFS